MSPTVFSCRGYRFFFFSREEERMHVHVSGNDGEAKFWLEPIVSLAYNSGMPQRRLKEIHRIVEEKHDAIAKAWKKHFRG